MLTQLAAKAGVRWEQMLPDRLKSLGGSHVAVVAHEFEDVFDRRELGVARQRDRMRALKGRITSSMKAARLGYVFATRNRLRGRLAHQRWQNSDD
jgi:hypothetical protein